MSVQIVGTTHKPPYFLISVSTRENLELCIKYGLAGFPCGPSGAWTFCEIETGDFVSFLYGARAHNLYRVAERVAIVDAETLPPWKPLIFRESGKTYSFPFRLYLQPIRLFVEPLVRTEFSYVAETLLLRGGYRKTHFQADQTTLQSVSQMGESCAGSAEELVLPEHRKFNPSFTRNPALAKPPEVFRFQELILQTAIRRRLQDEAKLGEFLKILNQDAGLADSLEILGEKALSQGHIDLLLKQRVPLGSSVRIPIEVKMNLGQARDLAQLRAYMDELGECPLGVLIAADFSKDAIRQAPLLNTILIQYVFSTDLRSVQTFDAICRNLTLRPFAE